MVVAMTAPWSLAVVSGTGIAPAVAVMEFFVPAAASMGLDPTRLGTVAALGAHFGRTMSPAAAVVMVCGEPLRGEGHTLDPRGRTRAAGRRPGADRGRDPDFPVIAISRFRRIPSAIQFQANQETSSRGRQPLVRRRQ